MQNFSQTQLDRLADIVRKTRPLFENTELLSSVHQKGQADFVTDVDYQVQSFLLSELAAFRPDIQFMGEEKDNSNIDFSGLVWILAVSYTHLLNISWNVFFFSIASVISPIRDVSPIRIAPHNLLLKK